MSVAFPLQKMQSLRRFVNRRLPRRWPPVRPRLPCSANVSTSLLCLYQARLKSTEYVRLVQLLEGERLLPFSIGFYRLRGSTVTATQQDHFVGNQLDTEAFPSSLILPTSRL